MCFLMKNITLKVDDETYRKARIRAAETGTSVSAMVRDFLCAATGDEASQDTHHQEIVAKLQAIYAAADERAVRRSEPLIPPTRDELYAERIH